MRPLLAAALTVALAAGCSLVQPPPAAETPAAVETPEASSSLEKTPPPAARTRAELAYLDALDKTLGKELGDGESINQEAYLEDGRDICDQAADHPIEAVQAAIDGMEQEGDVYKAALTRLCSKHKRLWGYASTGFADGSYTVGDDLKAGTYRTLRRPVTDCYWERSTGSGGIIDNGLINNAPRGITVTVRVGEGFTSRECGPWVRA